MLGAKPNIREATGPQQAQLEQQAAQLADAEARITELETYISALDGRRPVEMIDADDLFLFDGATGLGQSIWAGWALCDGRNGTPDLRERFIAGYNPANPAYAIEAAGGAATVALTVDELPAHDHAPDAAYIGLLKADGQSTVGAIDATTPNTEPNLGSIGAIQSVGSNQAHENRPPYYTLAFVKKIT